MKLILSFFICLILTGCGSPIVRDTFTESKVPVPVLCKVAKVEKPSMPLQEASPEEPFPTKLKKALAEIEIRKGYELLLESAIESCSDGWK